MARNEISLWDVNLTLTTINMTPAAAHFLAAKGIFNTHRGQYIAQLEARYGMGLMEKYSDLMGRVLPAFADGLRNQPVDDVDAALRTFVEEGVRFQPGALKIYEQLGQGTERVFVTTTPRPIVEALIRYSPLKGDHIIATELEVRGRSRTLFPWSSGGVYTGRIGKQIASAESKQAAVREYVGQENTAGANNRIRRAFGNSPEDLPLLEMAREPGALYPDEELYRIAIERGWFVYPSDEEVKDCVAVTLSQAKGNGGL